MAGQGAGVDSTAWSRDGMARQGAGVGWHGRELAWDGTAGSRDGMAQQGAGLPRAVYSATAKLLIFLSSL